MRWRPPRWARCGRTKQDAASCSTGVASAATDIIYRLEKEHLTTARTGRASKPLLLTFGADVDVPLTKKGINEAMAGGRSFAHVEFDMVFTSRLWRSRQTATLALAETVTGRVPVHVRGGFHGDGSKGDSNRLRLRAAAHWALEHASCCMIPLYSEPELNERCYGDLQGLNKEEAQRAFGKDTVRLWRRSIDTRPPGGESLEETSARVVSLFQSTLEPLLQEGNNILLVAHGNVLRVLIAHISELTPQECLKLKIGTALPIVYVYNREWKKMAECCCLPPIDEDGNPVVGGPRGLISGVNKGDTDGLI
eukprot:jgi/Mesvir1/27213/Mv07057-RA.1